jgi:DNA mismatch repair protein MutL
MPTIRQLPASVVNKIAAGEVIERPASVVKELMENAVDAGAQQIEVRMEKGGTDLLHVCDDGCGIEGQELTLAVTSHATSKLAEAEDLFSVSTLGFRGEALASLAEVSRLKIRSRTRQSVMGNELAVAGGESLPVVPCPCAPGTQVEVSDLFFNTPVRRKFLRTVSTEFAHASEAFQRIALAFPERSFRLAHGGRDVYQLPPVADWRERIASLFGAELAEALLWVEHEDGDVGVSGFVAHPSHNRSHARMQFLFLNGRYIRDRALQHALAEAYRGCC